MLSTVTVNIAIDSKFSIDGKFHEAGYRIPIQKTFYFLLCFFVLPSIGCLHPSPWLIPRGEMNPFVNGICHTPPKKESVFFNDDGNQNRYIAEFVGKHLVCSGCEQKFETSVCTPTLLPCLHSVCNTCLEAAQSTGDSTKDSITTVCPSCQQRVPSPEGVLQNKNICPDFHTDFLAEYLGLYRRHLEALWRLRQVDTSCCCLLLQLHEIPL